MQIAVVKLPNLREYFSVPVYCCPTNFFNAKCRLKHPIFPPLDPAGGCAPRLLPQLSRFARCATGLDASACFARRAPPQRKILTRKCHVTKYKTLARSNFPFSNFENSGTIQFSSSSSTSRGLYPKNFEKRVHTAR